MAKKAMKAMKKGMKKAMKSVKSMPKSAIADALGEACEKKRSEVSKVLEALADLASKEVKKGKFTIPGVCMIKTRHKPATKAGYFQQRIKYSSWIQPDGNSTDDTCNQSLGRQAGNCVVACLRACVRCVCQVRCW